MSSSSSSIFLPVASTASRMPLTHRAKHREVRGIGHVPEDVRDHDVEHSSVRKGRMSHVLYRRIHGVSAAKTSTVSRFRLVERVSTARAARTAIAAACRVHRALRCHVRRSCRVVRDRKRFSFRSWRIDIFATRSVFARRAASIIIDSFSGVKIGSTARAIPIDVAGASFSPCRRRKLPRMSRTGRPSWR